MIQDKIFFDEKDPTGISYNTPFTVYGSYEGRLWSKTPSGTIKYYTQNSDLSVYATTGSNQFSGSQTVTGSLTVTGGITGSVTTASYVEYTSVANKPTLVSGSSQVTYSGLTGVPAGIVSSSAQVGEYGVFATTGSNQFNGSQAITGSLTVTGQVVAQTLNVQQVTSSIVYSSGSNIFGNSLGNTQQFTGSVSVTGSLAVAGAVSGTSGTLTGALTGTSGTFSGNLNLQGAVTRNINFYDSSNTNINAQIQYDQISSTSGQLFFGTNNAGTFATRLTLSNTGAATFSSTIAASGRISTSHSTSGDYAAVFYNTSATGEGVTIRGGSTSSHNAFIVQPYNGATTLFSILATGAATFSSSVTATGGLISNGGAIGYGGGELGFGVTTNGATSGIYTLATGSPIIYFDHRATSNTGFFVFRNGTGGANTLLTLSAAGAATFASSVNALQFTATDGYGLNVGNFQVGAITGNRFYIYNNTLGIDNISISPSTGITTFSRAISGTSATFSSSVTAVNGIYTGTGEVVANTAAGTVSKYIRLSNNSGHFYGGVEGATPDIITGATAYDASIRGYSGISFSANGGSNLHMRITSAGQVQISNSILRLNASSTTSVSTSVTTISTGSNTYGGLAIIWGADSGGNVWTDLLFYSLGQVYVIRSQDVSGGPFGRTYSVDGSGSLRLAMGGGTYTVRYQALLTS